jgi:hypothetical protein
MMIAVDWYQRRSLDGDDFDKSDSRRFPLKRLHQPADVALQHGLLSCEDGEVPPHFERGEPHRSRKPHFCIDVKGR